VRVLADGCFDPIHVGHAMYLRTLVDLCGSGHQLFIRVATDPDIQHKGRKSFQNDVERMVMLRELLPRAEVHRYPTLVEAIRSIHPDILAKGIEWEGQLPPDVLSACDRHAVHVLFTRTRSASSTERLHGLHS